MTAIATDRPSDKDFANSPGPLSSSVPGLHLAPLGLTFDPPDLEDRFRAQHHRAVLPQIRVLAGVALGLFALGILVDYLTGQEQEMSVALRLLAMGGVVVGLALTWTPLFRRFLQQLVGMGVLAVGGVFTAGYVQGTGDTLYLFVMVQVFVAVIAYFLSGLLFRSALLVTLANMAGFAVAALWLRPMPAVDTAIGLTFLFTGAVLTTLAGYMLERSRRIGWHQTLVIDDERRRNEALLLNILPKSIADRMKGAAGLIADQHPTAAILFIDIVNFTPLSAQLSPDRLVAVLNAIFSRFDDIADNYALEKIKTIGDAYMVAAGLPEDRPDALDALAAAALDMRDAVRRIDVPSTIRLDLRMGMHVGPVVAGVIGKRKFVYDLWGDTVNIASRMESHGEPGRILVTDAVEERLRGRFVFTARGEIDVKGKGLMRTWFLDAPSHP